MFQNVICETQMTAFRFVSEKHNLLGRSPSSISGTSGASCRLSRNPVPVPSGIFSVSSHLHPGIRGNLLVSGDYFGELYTPVFPVSLLELLDYRRRNCVELAGGCFHHDCNRVVLCSNTLLIWTHRGEVSRCYFPSLWWLSSVIAINFLNALKLLSPDWDGLESPPMHLAFLHLLKQCGFKHLVLYKYNLPKKCRKRMMPYFEDRQPTSF
ncbi:hypothetical protein AKJ16_DCAP12301 [Drosera capensis]